MKILKITLLILCFSTLLTACTGIGTSENAPDSGLIIDSYKTQLDHYAGLLETIRDELIQSKEESFILKCSYEAEIEALKQEISALVNKSDNTTNGEGASTNRNDKHNVYPNPLEETSADTIYKYEVIEQKLTLFSSTYKAIN